MNKKDKKNILMILAFVAVAIFLIFILPIMLYVNDHKRNNDNVSAEDLIKQNQQIEDINENDNQQQEEENIEIVDVNESEKNRVNINSMEIPPIEVPEIENNNNNNTNRDYSDPFYKLIREQLAKQKNIKPMSMPKYYTPKDNYVQNCTDSNGVLHIFQKQPILIYVPRGEYYDPITQAFVAYNNQFQGFITFNTVAKPSDADIKIVLTDNLSDRHDNENVLGLTFTRKYDTDGNIVFSEIYLLTNYKGTAVSKTSMYNTVLHEIGHAIGIKGHSENPQDVLYKSQTEEEIGKLKYFSERDIETLKLMYSGNTYVLDKILKGAQKTKLEENIKYAESLNDADAYLKVANSYYQMKQYSKALETYKKALKLNPDNSRIYADLARCYLAAKQYNYALTYADYAVKKADNNEDRAYAYHLAGIVYNEQGKSNDALKYYYNALVSDPSSSDYFYNYIRLNMYLKNYKEAKEAYDTYYHTYKSSFFTPEQQKVLDYLKDYKP